MQSGEMMFLADDPLPAGGVACQFLAMWELCAWGAAAVELEGGDARVYHSLKLAGYVAARLAEFAHSMALLVSGVVRQKPYLAVAPGYPGKVLEASMGSAVCQVLCAALDVSH